MTIALCLPQRRPLEAVKTRTIRRKLPLMRNRLKKLVRPSMLNLDLTIKKQGVLHVMPPHPERAYVPIQFGDEDDPTSDTEPRKRKVHFDTVAETLQVPHKNDYTACQKRLMYNTRKQIRKQAKRNVAEYQYDGWSIDKAAEEDAFVTVDGELVHPSHSPCPAE